MSLETPQKTVYNSRVVKTKNTIEIASRYAAEPQKSALLSYGAQCIESGAMDRIGLGRQVYADPLIASKLASGNENDIKYCTACDNCLELLIQQSKVGGATHDKSYVDELIKTRTHKL